MKKKQLRKVIKMLLVMLNEDRPSPRRRRTIAHIQRTSPRLLEDINDKLDRLLQLANGEPDLGPLGPFASPDYEPAPPAHIPSRDEQRRGPRIPGLLAGYWIELDKGSMDLPRSKPIADPDGAIVLGGPGGALALDFKLNGQPWRHNAFELEQCIHLSNIKKGRPMFFVTYDQNARLSRAWAVASFDSADLGTVKSYWPKLLPELLDGESAHEQLDDFVALELAEVSVDDQKPTADVWEAPPLQSEGGIFNETATVVRSGYGYVNEAGMPVEDDDTHNED